MLRVDGKIFESGKKKLQIQNYLDMCGQGLSKNNEKIAKKKKRERENVAPLQPRRFELLQVGQTTLHCFNKGKKVKCKTKLEQGITFV